MGAPNLYIPINKVFKIYLSMMGAKCRGGGYECLN